MINLKYAAVSLVTAGTLATGAIGVANAATPTNKNVGTSGIPRSAFKQERLEAQAQVLNTSTSNVQSAHKDKTFKQLLSNAGMTTKTFHQKVKAQLTSELESQGYTQDQVTIALQHRQIVHLRHHKK